MNTTDTSDPEHSSPRRPTVTLQTVGCKLNQAESESLARQFLAAGFEVITPAEVPDVYVLNTCTVTHIADRKCRQYLRAFRRFNPRALVIALGCYADRDEAGLRQIDGIDLVISNSRKDELVQIVQSRIGEKAVYPGGNGRGALSSPLRTRTMVKIQEGCSRGCSYCIVPHVRGSEQSTSSEAVIAQIKERTAEGYKEAILTGTRIGAYMDGGIGLVELIQTILAGTSIARIRISSLEPRDITPALIQLWRESARMCPHIHLALQSGSDSVLKRMRRSYTVEEYEKAVKAIRDAVPRIAVTTDVIVGFPGETDDEFEESYQFCERMGFARIHVFPYSPREGTPAAMMTNQLSDNIQKDRIRRMLDLASRSSQTFNQQFIGSTLSVLWEERKGEDVWIGHTDNYIKAFTQTSEALGNTIRKVKMQDEYEDGLWGEVTFPATCANYPVKGE